MVPFALLVRASHTCPLASGQGQWKGCAARTLDGKKSGQKGGATTCLFGCRHEELVFESDWNQRAKGKVTDTNNVPKI